MSDKDLESFKLSRPLQIELFEIIEAPGREKPYSNTIELYDALPKYNWSAKREYDDLSNAVIKRRCTIRGQSFTVKIRPAIIDKDGSTSVLIYPGQREELVEDALRKLAVEGKGQMLDGKAGVLFTLYELQKELEEMGHGFNLNEIKEAIFVCRGSLLECISDDGQTSISSTFFPMVGLTTRGQFMEKGGDARCYVQFHPMVNESILKLTFRQYNYRLAMDIRSPLARYIYKRMAHYWTQASTNSPYTPSLVSFLSQSPRELSPTMYQNTRAMRNALDVLIKQEVISGYDAEEVKDGRRIVDVRYVIRPHAEFVKQTKAANKLRQITLLRAASKGLIDHDILEDVTNKRESDDL